MEQITVAGAAAIGDYIFKVDHLPEKGEIVQIKDSDFMFVPGGCAPNIAAGIASLGKAAPVLCYPVGKDSEGIEMEEHWKRKGIMCHLTYEEGQSGKSWMFMQEDGTTMCFAHAGAADAGIPEETGLWGEWCIVAPVFNRFTEGYLSMAVKQKKRILMTGIGTARIGRFLEQIEILIINQCEAKKLSDEMNCKDGGIAENFPDLCIVITDGGKGSTVFYHHESMAIPIIKPDRIVDFTGAGDAYVSGFMSAVLSGCGYETAAYYGAANASFAIERWGGQEYAADWKLLTERLSEQFPKRGWTG